MAMAYHQPPAYPPGQPQPQPQDQDQAQLQVQLQAQANVQPDVQANVQANVQDVAQAEEPDDEEGQEGPPAFQPTSIWHHFATLLLSFFTFLTFLPGMFSVPITNRFYFMQVWYPNGEVIRYGSFGYTGSKVSVGYSFLGLDGTAVDDIRMTGLSTKCLVLHSISAAIAWISFVVCLLSAVCARASPRSKSPITLLVVHLSFLLFVLSVLLSMIDDGIFINAKYYYNSVALTGSITFTGTTSATATTGTTSGGYHAEDGNVSLATICGTVASFLLTMMACACFGREKWAVGAGANQRKPGQVHPLQVSVEPQPA